MTDRQQLIVNNVDTAKQLILDAERWIWAHPQTGYTEWQAHDYLVEKYEALGYTLVKAGNIPGFYTDVETGKPGPKVAIFGELDALDIANHPESVNGMTHCCGHNAQSAALLGIAAVLKQPYALDGLCGSIRLVVVPAEEMIQLAFREELRQKGIIKYNGGKTEFMYRGLLDGVDMAMMVHGMTKGSGVNEDGDTDLDFQALLGMNGCIAKNIRYKGKSAHAGGAPHMGVNAEYAAMLGLQACNDLRETFQEKDTIRFHPILMGANCAVNIIPDEMKIESYVRGKSLEAIKRENIKVNRALTGAALSMGAGVELSDRPGYAPEYHDPTFMKLAEDCCVALCGRKKVVFDYNGWSTGSSDFGDVTCVMPGVQINAGGAVGTLHGIDFQITDPNRMCVNAAKVQLFLVDALLSNNAVAAKEIIANYKPLGILKDTHTGAFAVIFGGLYLILYAAACTELDEGSALLTAIGFILSRALSGLSTATFPEARKHGMLADFMKDARKKTVAVCMLVIFFLTAFLELLFGGICGGIVVITTVLIFLWYRHMAVQEFGGVTGDLAGFFLQICELGILLAAVIGKAVF